MKLEAVDRTAADPSSAVCVATVANVLDGRILIHFDGDNDDGGGGGRRDYWTRPSASPHIRPVGWCAENGVKLVPPRGKKEHSSSSGGSETVTVV